ncbi:MAG: hypothetical protein CL467_04735 [Acidimicrobiaceae bacterium]|nr:hypothetical protein [Acidimicrobiaceae bacterium]
MVRVQRRLRQKRGAGCQSAPSVSRRPSRATYSWVVFDDTGTVALDPAGWWTRAGAVFIDILLFLSMLVVPIVFVVVGLVLCWEETVEGFVADGAGVLIIVVGAVLGLGAFVWSGWLFGYRQGVSGTTPGKRRRRIQLIDVATGEPPGGARGVGRWLVPVLVGGIQGIGSVVQLVDILWPVWDARNQRLIDKVMRTQVVVGLPQVMPVDGSVESPSPIS